MHASRHTTSSKNTHKGHPERGDFFSKKPGVLTLSDGMTFEGSMPHWQTGPYVGEVVFNTGMTGYVESLTDPSYAGQILTFTYPLIGNYGVDETSGESPKIQASGVIVSEATLQWSHERSTKSLLEWLHEQQIPILMGVDTRSLTKYLRTRGTMGGAIASTNTPVSQIKLSQKYVTIPEPIEYGSEDAKKTVVLVDCGEKENILRSLLSFNVRVRRVPANYDYSKEPYDGVFLSNGPGDPTEYPETIAVAKKAMDAGKPVFGICLGSQIMALAAGAKTYKLKFGHRGHNQPCLESSTNKGYITSQNHGYAVDEASLPFGWEVTFKNLNDGSVEGIAHKTKPFFSVQFHPEACPGPTDTAWLFERFYESL